MQLSCKIYLSEYQHISHPLLLPNISPYEFQLLIIRLGSKIIGDPQLFTGRSNNENQSSNYSINHQHLF